jgi:hypothetical protein
MNELELKLVQIHLLISIIFFPPSSFSSNQTHQKRDMEWLREKPDDGTINKHLKQSKKIKHAIITTK